MEYFSVDFPSGAKLGLNVVVRSEDEPNLGTTLIENIPDINSYAHQNGIRSGDFIIAANNRYLAFAPHEECIRALKTLLTDKKPISLLFCRPIVAQWDSILSDSTGAHVIREGVLFKRSGFLRNKVSRYVKLMKNRIEFHKDKEEPKSFPVSQLSLVTTGNQPSFFGSNSSNDDENNANNVMLTVILGTTELSLEADDAKTCILWQHAIHVVVKRAFDHVLPAFYRVGSGSLLKPNEKKPNIENQQHDSNRILLNQRRNSFTLGNKGDGSQRSIVSSAHGHGAPFWLLSLCAVKVNEAIRPEPLQNKINQSYYGGIGTDVKTDYTLTDPRVAFSDEMLNEFNYDFALEKKILGSHSS